MLKNCTLFAVLTVMLCYCGTSKNNKSNQQPNDPDSTIKTDTMDFRPPPPDPGLAPGTARITGTILTLKDGKAEIMVLSVDEYGSSTPVIASNTKMKVNVPDSLAVKLEKNKKIVCLLNYQQVLGSGKNQISWTLKKVSSIENQTN